MVFWPNSPGYQFVFYQNWPNRCGIYVHWPKKILGVSIIILNFKLLHGMHMPLRYSAVYRLVAAPNSLYMPALLRLLRRVASDVDDYRFVAQIFMHMPLR